ncbi:MAG: DNA translocase FtsK [Eubacteriaceae bacterium]|nr:DNA translocase FtsK [Eubacteriaceae bacterium]
MATRKKTSSNKKKKAAPKKTAAQRRREAALKREIWGIVLICLGALLLFFTFGAKTGSVGGAISSLIKRLFGTFGRVALSCAVISHGIFVLTGREKVGGYIYALSLIFTVASSLSVRYFLVYSYKDPLLYGALWQTATPGGFVCSLLAKVMVEAFQAVGSWIILIFAAIVLFIVIFKKSFVDMVRRGAEQMETTAKNIAEKNQKRRIERKNEQALFLEAKKESEDIEDYSRGKTDKASENGKTLLETDSGDRIVFIEAAKKKKTSRKTKGGGLFGGFDEEPSGVNPTDKTISGQFIELTGGKPAEQKNSEALSAAKAPEPPEKQAFIKEKLTPQAQAQALEEVSQLVEEESKDDHLDKYYKFPPLSLLARSEGKSNNSSAEQKEAQAKSLVKMLNEFGVTTTVTNITVAPTVTRYELQLEPGVKVSKVASLSDDIAYSLAAKQVRVEAPIPGKKAVGIEIPNEKPDMVRLSEIITDKAFTANKSPLAACLGKTVSGQTLVMDITKMPHILIAGATGSGKSVCINTIIISILYHTSPEDVKLILIDPKMVELNVYDDIPHLLIPVVTNAKEASGALGWAVREMEDRYKKFHDNKVKDIYSYNAKMLSEGGDKIPHIALIIDEFADLMMVSAQQVENSICRLAQLARACGIHLVLATQRPSVNVITGTIKANIPSRISFAVASQIDSRTILDSSGAEMLLGKGDMLYKPMDEGVPIRAQGAFVSDEEIEKVTTFVKAQYETAYDDEVHEQIMAAAAEVGVKQTANIEGSEEEDDETLIKKALEIGYANKLKLSTSMIQRKLRLGYARAGRIMDEMEQRGYVSQANGSKPRDVLISPEALE